jgi:hypothetical protein
MAAIHPVVIDSHQQRPVGSCVDLSSGQVDLSRLSLRNSVGSALCRTPKTWLAMHAMTSIPAYGVPYLALP